MYASATYPLQVWSDQLAQIAQSYAEQCKWGHNPDRSSSYPGYVGENLYVTTASIANYSAAVASWYNEVKDYDYDRNECSAVCGHYTQVCESNYLHNVIISVRVLEVLKSIALLESYSKFSTGQVNTKGHAVKSGQFISASPALLKPSQSLTCSTHVHILNNSLVLVLVKMGELL